MLDVLEMGSLDGAIRTERSRMKAGSHTGERQVVTLPGTPTDWWIPERIGV